MIPQRYQAEVARFSDIYQHLPILRKYAQKCIHVTECGVRSAVSTWALAQGLLENGSEVKRLLGVDLAHSPEIEKAAMILMAEGIRYNFIRGDSAKAPLEETDLLFIDTWHVYAHLKRELANQARKARKYIILHDTTVDGEVGETIRNGWDAEAQSKETGYPVEEIKRGLWPAVVEFLAEHPEWALVRRYHHCHGLTILERNALRKEGRLLRLDPGSSSLDWWQRQYRNWHPEFFPILEHFARGQYLDLGAGAGQLALYAGELAEKAVALELDPEAVRDLTLNAKANDLPLQIYTQPLTKDGRAVTVGPSPFGWVVKAKAEQEQDRTANSLTLAEILKREQLRELTLVRVNLQGGEEELLEQLFDEDLWPGTNCPALLITFNQSRWRNQDLGRFRGLWKKYHYIYQDGQEMESKNLSGRLDGVSLLFCDEPFRPGLPPYHLTVKSDIPVYLLAYNNPTYLVHMLEQLRGFAEVTVIDNGSDYPVMRQLFQDNPDIKVWTLPKHLSWQEFLQEKWADLPDLFALGQPTLEFPPDLPLDFLTILAQLTERRQLYKAGLALEVSDSERFQASSIYQGEIGNWAQPLADSTLELYAAPVESTFAVWNKKYQNEGAAVRVGGPFICRHLPWYRDNPLALPAEEIDAMRQGNHISC